MSHRLDAPMQGVQLAVVPEGMSSPEAEHVLAAEQVHRRNDEIITYYLGAMRIKWRPNTIRIRRIQLTQFARAIFPTPIAEATEVEVLNFYDGLDCKPETRISWRSGLRGFYNWLITRARPQVRVDNPALLLDAPKLTRGVPRPILPHDYQLAIACSMRDPEMYCWLGLMGCCGLRSCEIAWLRGSDVEDRADGTGLLHVTGKGGHQRTVPVGSDLMLVLMRFVRLAGTGPVFTRPRTGAARTPQDVSARTNKFLAGLGINATAHQLRHKFGGDYHQLDPDIFRQADLMGHASVEMTRRYSQVAQVEATRHVEKLTRARLSDTADRAASAAPYPAWHRGYGNAARGAR